MMSFDFSNPCDHRCVWCSWQKHRREEGGMLQPDVFESIISDCVSLGIRGYEVCGGGEPLLNPHAHKYISQLGSIGKLLLVTNGSKLTEEDAYYCKTIRVSLDAATAKTHRKLHQVGGFEKILKNVGKAAEITRVGLGFLVHPDNWWEIPKFAELARDLGCQFAHIRPCFTDYDEVRDIIGYDWFEWIKCYGDRVERMIENAREYETDDFKVYATLYKTQPKRDWEFKKCYAAYFNPLISPTGAVWICCERRGVAGSKIGTVGVDGTFSEIWFSEKHKRLMDVCPNELCPAKDKFLGYNRAIWKAYIEQSFDLEWI